MEQRGAGALLEMQEKHPRTPPLLCLKMPLPPSPSVTSKNVHKAIKGFNTGSDPGPLGLRVKHLSSDQALPLCHQPVCSKVEVSGPPTSGFGWDLAVAGGQITCPKGGREGCEAIMYATIATLANSPIKEKSRW